MTKSQFSSSRVFAMWLIASIFYAYQYILRVMPNILLEDIMHQFSISAVTFGQFSGVYYLGYSLMHLPIGILLDRYSPRKVMAFCIFLTILGLLPLILSSHWMFPIIGRILIGMGSSASILGVFKIIRMTFHESAFSKMLSYSVTIGVLGAIYGGGPVHYMREILGYEAVVQAICLLGFVLLVATYWIIPEMKSVTHSSISSSIKEVVSNKKVLLCCIFAGLMVGPLEGFADVWGTIFLKQVLGYDSTLAASLPSMLFVGVCFGGPILSMISTKIQNDFFTIIVAGILMTIGFSMLLAEKMPPFAVSCLFILIGMCSAYQILAICKAASWASEETAGLTTALANMIIMLFGYAFHSIIGGVVNSLGGPGSPEALMYGLVTIPAALVIGSLGFIFLLIQEKREKRLIQREA